VVHKAWQKVPFVADLLREGHKYVYFIDGDSVFTNFTAKLERFAALDKDFVFTGDFSTILNTGHLFLRNSQWTLDMLDAVWAQTEFCNSEGWYEQAQWLWWMAKGDCSLVWNTTIPRSEWLEGGDCDAYIQRTMPHLSAHVACVPQMEMNAYLPGFSHDDKSGKFYLPPPLSANLTCYDRPWEVRFGGTAGTCLSNRTLWRPGMPVFHAAGLKNQKESMLKAAMQQQETFELAQAPRLLPKLVHHIMPVDFTKPENPWKNPIWEGSYLSWLKHFPAPEFEHRIWVDEELWVLMNSTFPHLAEIFHGRGLIFKMDTIRAVLLYMFGGIYADMDYEPLTNFHGDIPHSRVSMVESPYWAANMTQNSFMASPPYMLFWLHYLGNFCAQKVVSKVAVFTSAYATKWAQESVNLSIKRDAVYVLPCLEFQRNSKDLPPTNASLARCGDATDTKNPPKGMHWGTFTWGPGAAGTGGVPRWGGFVNKGLYKALWNLYHPNATEYSRPPSSSWTNPNRPTRPV
jgi:hypothetical protein